MSGLLFGRSVIVEIGITGQPARQFKGLRVRFDVAQTPSGTPNKGKIEVFNLTRESAAIADKPHSQVRLIAGYDGQEEVVFVGDINPKSSKTELEGVDYVTRMEVADGIDNYKKAFVEKSYREGTPFAQVLADLAQVMQGGTGTPLLFDVPADTVVSGLSVTGPAHKALDDLTAKLGLSWSVQDGAVQVVKDGGATPKQAVLLSPTTGLVGIPKRKGKGIELTSLLIPQIRPGRQVQLQSRLLNGAYVAQKVTHKGDTHDKDFYTVVEATPL